MKIRDLMDRLNAMMPYASAEQLAAATRDYQTVLGEFAGPRLEAAWRGTIATWSERWRPLPADIRKHVPETVRAATKGINHRAVDVARRELLPRLVEDWWRGHGLEVNTFLGEFAHDDREERLGPLRPSNWREHSRLPCTDRDFARCHLGDMVLHRCWDEAGRQALGAHPHAVEVTEADLAVIRGRVRSQTGKYPKRTQDLDPQQGHWSTRARFVPRLKAKELGAAVATTARDARAIGEHGGDDEGALRTPAGSVGVMARPAPNDPFGDDFALPIEAYEEALA